MIGNDHSLNVGFYLARREIARSNPWTTILIILIIVLTFFNMLFLGGMIMGIVGSFLGAYKSYYSGDVMVIPATSKNDLARTSTITSVAKSLPTFKALTVRYVVPAILEYNYRQKVRPSDLSESAGGQLVGIDPEAEDQTTHLSKAIVAGSYLSMRDADQILVGSTLLAKYATIRNASTTVGLRILKNADVGSRVRLTVGGKSLDVTIKGVITTNATVVDGRIYMSESVVRNLMGNTSLHASEIAIALAPNASASEAKNYLIKNLNNDTDFVVQTFDDALPAGISSTIDIYNKLLDIVGGIALIVAMITIFIVIFVNAVTRRKFIGILKGIGISATAIQISYTIQALFYAVLGVFIAAVLILGLIVPYFLLHPIYLANFPVTLSIGLTDIIPKGTILIVASVISGFVPAWIVTRENTLDAILGR